MKLNKLKGRIIEQGMNIEMVADAIGVDRSSLYRKFNNYEKLTIGEVSKIKDVLSLSDDDAYDIFLA